MSRSNVSSEQARVHFTQGASQLTVEIVRPRRSPVIASLHGSLLALGLIVASYQAVRAPLGLVERVVLERRDGGAIDAALSAATQAAILPIALDEAGA